VKITLKLYLKRKKLHFLFGSNTRRNIDVNCCCSLKEKGLTVINDQLILKCGCLEKDTIKRVKWREIIR